MKSEFLTEIERLDPQVDHCRIVHLTICDGFLWDVTRSLELALFRTFAAPSIGGLLHRTGEFEKNGQKRYDAVVIDDLTVWIRQRVRFPRDCANEHDSFAFSD